MTSLLARLFGRAHRKVALSRSRPALECLEDRLQPSVSAIQCNFNGTAINPGKTVWFNSVLKVSGVTTPVTLTVNHASISYVVNGTTYTQAVPNSVITLTPGATSASTTFDAGTNAWKTSSPPNPSGNIFLAGAALPVTTTLNAITPTWTADFHSDTPGVTVQWQWAAAVYTSFTSAYAAVGVKPVDSNNLSQYQNSDHAGTPENFTAFVTGGATGGGGSNWSGSYSSTKSVTPDVVQTPVSATASISGHVAYINNMGATVPLACANLLLTDPSGVVIARGMTDCTGAYTIGGLSAGTYTLTVNTAPYGALSSTIGTVNGIVDGSAPTPSQFIGIALNDGDAGINYDFVADGMIA